MRRREHRPQATALLRAQPIFPPQPWRLRVALRILHLPRVDHMRPFRANEARREFRHRLHRQARMRRPPFRRHVTWRGPRNTRPKACRQAARSRGDSLMARQSDNAKLRRIIALVVCAEPRVAYAVKTRGPNRLHRVVSRPYVLVSSGDRFAPITAGPCQCCGSRKRTSFCSAASADDVRTTDLDIRDWEGRTRPFATFNRSGQMFAPGGLQPPDRTVPRTLRSSASHHTGESPPAGATR